MQASRRARLQRLSPLPASSTSSSAPTAPTTSDAPQSCATARGSTTKATARITRLHVARYAWSTRSPTNPGRPLGRAKPSSRSGHTPRRRRLPRETSNVFIGSQTVDISGASTVRPVRGAAFRCSCLVPVWRLFLGFCGSSGIIGSRLSRLVAVVSTTYRNQQAAPTPRRFRQPSHTLRLAALLRLGKPGTGEGRPAEARGASEGGLEAPATVFMWPAALAHGGCPRAEPRERIRLTSSRCAPGRSRRADRPVSK